MLNGLNFNRIFFRGKAWSAEQVRSSIEDLARYLEKNITSRSPFIYLYAYNHIKTVVAYFAVLRAGLRCVMINPAIKPLELEEYRKTAPDAGEFRFYLERDEWNYQDELRIKDYRREYRCSYPVYDGPATVVFTAAESGRPMGAVLSPANVYADAAAHSLTNESDKNSVICALLPFHHMFGFVTGVVSPLVSGSSILIEDAPNYFQVKSVADSLKYFRVTHLYSVPIIFYLLSKVPDIISTFGNMKYLTSGGYKLPFSLFALYKQKFNVEIHEGYGLTEASPVCTWNYPGKTVKPESVGQAIRCCEIMIAGDGDTALPPGKTGEICVRGENVMQGYIENKDETEKVLKDGWLHTGDIGSMDEEGYLYLNGLKKRMLNTFGMNVYPAEVERLIRMNPDVRDVRVYGEYSELQGDIIKAQLKLEKKGDEFEKALKSWCMDNISNFKLPKFWKFE